MALSRAEAAKKLEQYLLRAEMQQKELAAKIGVEPSYVSRWVTGNIGWVGGSYFGRIASALRLTDDEIEELNPAAVVKMENPHPLSAAANGYRVPKPEPRPIPEALLEAAEQFGGDPKYAGLREYRWQRWMEQVPHRERPSTPLEWLDFYMSVKNTVDPPEPQE